MAKKTTRIKQGIGAEECQAAVKRLNLTKTNAPNVGRDSNGVLHNIPVWERYSPEERAHLLRMLTLNVRGFDDPTVTQVSPQPRP